MTFVIRASFVRENARCVGDALNRARVVDVKGNCEMPAAFGIDVTGENFGFEAGRIDRRAGLGEDVALGGERNTSFDERPIPARSRAARLSGLPLPLVGNSNCCCRRLV